VALYRDQGVVLRSIKLGEADRIVTIFTQAHGKIRAVAKGVRKTHSRFGARLEPTSHIALQCYEGRELDIVTQVETIDANRTIREHFGALTHAISMLESVDSVSVDRERNLALYRMLVGGLRTMNENPSPMIAPAFYWKVLSLEGFHPMLDACAHCGSSTEPLIAFALGEGGAICRNCAPAVGIRILPRTLELLRRIFDRGLREVLAEPAGPATQEVERLGISALEFHLERRLRSASLLV
jgi:DNA repair protein RecO (recombination protein O)